MILAKAELPYTRRVFPSLLSRREICVVHDVLWYAVVGDGVIMARRHDGGGVAKRGSLVSHHGDWRYRGFREKMSVSVPPFWKILMKGKKTKGGRHQHKRGFSQNYSTVQYRVGGGKGFGPAWRRAVIFQRNCHPHRVIWMNLSLCVMMSLLVVNTHFLLVTLFIPKT